MLDNVCGSLVALAVVAICGWLAGCQDPDRDVTYNPFVENHGSPTVGSRVEGIPNRAMDRLDRFDSRLENTLY